jgi:hypothetical protein
VRAALDGETAMVNATELANRKSTNPLGLSGVIAWGVPTHRPDPGIAGTAQKTSLDRAERRICVELERRLKAVVPRTLRGSMIL